MGFWNYNKDCFIYIYIYIKIKYIFYFLKFIFNINTSKQLKSIKKNLFNLQPTQTGLKHSSVSHRYMTIILKEIIIAMISWLHILSFSQDERSSNVLFYFLGFIPEPNAEILTMRGINPHKMEQESKAIRMPPFFFFLYFIS